MVKSTDDIVRICVLYKDEYDSIRAVFFVHDLKRKGWEEKEPENDVEYMTKEPLNLTKRGGGIENRRFKKWFYVSRDENKYIILTFPYSELNPELRGAVIESKAECITRIDLALSSKDFKYGKRSASEILSEVEENFGKYDQNKKATAGMWNKARNPVDKGKLLTHIIKDIKKQVKMTIKDLTVKKAVRDRELKSLQDSHTNISERIRMLSEAIKEYNA